MRPLVADHTPAELLREVLHQNGLKQTDLVRRTGLSAKHVNQIAQGNVGISADMALLLERATDVPAARWMAAELVRHRIQGGQPTVTRQQIEQAVSHAVLTTTRVGDSSDEGAIAENAIHHVLEAIGVPVRSGGDG
jgi:plasmid maintenance system antidote protein VapI